MKTKNLEKDIQKNKKKLEKIAQTKGLCENFGENEVRKLEDKYHYNDLVYGTPDERLMAKMIADFDEWCMDYEG